MKALALPVVRCNAASDVLWPSVPDQGQRFQEREVQRQLLQGRPVTEWAASPLL